MLTIVMPAQSYDLTVLATVKAELGITDRAEDENLTRWITQASNIVARYCNRVFARETIAETFRLATRESDLLLSRYPVQSIASVQENDETLAAVDYEVKLEKPARRQSDLLAPRQDRRHIHGRLPVARRSSLCQQRLTSKSRSTTGRRGSTSRASPSPTRARRRLSICPG